MAHCTTTIIHCPVILSLRAEYLAISIWDIDIMVVILECCFKHVFIDIIDKMIDRIRSYSGDFDHDTTRTRCKYDCTCV